MRPFGSSLRRAVGLGLLVCLLAAPARAAEAVLPTGDRLHWDEGLSHAAGRVRKALPGIRERVAREIGFPQPGPAQIHLVAGVDRMRKVAGATVPEWAAGVCVGGRLIALRTDVSDRPSLLRSLETVLRHEWIHFAWAQAAGSTTRNLPLWVEEGLAERVGGGFSADAGRQLDLAAEARNLIAFHDIAKAWPRFQLDAALAYAQSRSWVEYFVTHAGIDVFRRILADTARPPESVDGPPFESAVFQHTKRPLSLWIEDWRAHVEDVAKPWYLRLFDDLFTSLMLIVGLVGGVAYFFMRVRRKKQIAALPDG